MILISLKKGLIVFDCRIYIMYQKAFSLKTPIPFEFQQKHQTYEVTNSEPASEDDELVTMVRY